MKRPVTGKDLMIVNMGPHHPSMHGVLRLIVTLDGEDVVDCVTMTESIKIIQQALEGLPGGPYENLEIRGFDRKRNPEWNDFEYRFISKKPSPTFELSK